VTGPVRGPDARALPVGMTPEIFEADLARMNALLEKSGAVVTLADGWQGVDPTKVPEDVLRAYEGLVSYGFANGLLR
jgi:hypothetical protein